MMVMMIFSSILQVPSYLLWQHSQVCVLDTPEIVYACGNAQNDRDENFDETSGQLNN